MQNIRVNSPSRSTVDYQTDHHIDRIHPVLPFRQLQRAVDGGRHHRRPRPLPHAHHVRPRPGRRVPSQLHEVLQRHLQTVGRGEFAKMELIVHTW